MYPHCFTTAVRALVRLLFVAAMAAGLPAWATDQLSYHNDLQSSGVNAAETAITPSNLSVSNFSKRYATPVDGQVYTQPLYRAGVTVTGGTQAGAHDMVFIGTQHDSVYGIDGNSGVIVWQTSLLASGLAGATSITPMPSGDTGSGDITPEIGICGTPVIDPATNLLYVAAKTKQIVNGDTSAPHYVYTLYKIDITNGNATANANIAGSTIMADTIDNGSYIYRTKPNAASTAQDPFVFGTGDGSINNTGGSQDTGGTSRVYFNARRQMNRPGLVLTGGRVYVAFASHGDNGPYHGWILGYNKTTLSLVAALNTTPNGGLGGIWQAGGITVMDAAGNFYFETGNGTFDGYDSGGGVTAGLITSGPQKDFPQYGNFGDCFVKVSLDSSTQASQNVNGWGLKITDYFSPFNNQALNSADADLGSGGCVLLPDSAGSAAHPHLLIGAGKEGKTYLIDVNDPTYGMGKFNAITDHVLQTQGGAIGSSFSTPAFFNGTLYWVGAGDNGKAFTIANAIMSSAPVKTTPDGFSWPGSTPSISANGTTNGVVWNIDRNTAQLRAYAADDYSHELWTSAQASGNRDQLGTPVKFSVPTVADGHVFVGTANTLACFGPPQPPTAPPAAPTGLVATSISGIEIDIYWTDNATNEDGYKVEQSPDGVTFNEVASLGVNAQNYSATALSANTTYYFRVRAYNSFNTLSYSNYSGIANAKTGAQPPSLDFSGGFANSGNLLKYLGNAKIVNNRAELTDGGGGEAGAFWTRSKMDVRKFSTQFSFQLTNPDADGFTFCIQNNNANIIGPSGGELGYQGIPNSIAVKFDLYPNLSTTGLYTNGTDPVEDGNAVDVTGDGLDFHSGHIFSVSLIYVGGILTEKITDTSTGASGTYNYTVDIPSTIGGSTTSYIGFTGGTGGLTAVQDIISWSYTVIPSFAPTAPDTLTAMPASGTQINLAWNDKSTNEDGFKVERRTGTTGSYAAIGVTGANQTMYIDSSLIPNTNYYYRVRATNAVGDSGPSNVASALTPVQPLTPANAHATSITSTQIAMAWTDRATNETAYKILRKTSTGSNFSVIATLPPDTTSYTDSGLNPGITYDYHIQAFNLAGYSDFSGFIALTLSPSIAVEQPIGTGIAYAGSRDYGSVLVGSSKTLTFTIRNIGTTRLTLGAITTDGVNAADFAVKITPAASVAPGKSTNFVLKFAPGASGIRSAMVHIANSDSANNPFNITVGGTGTTPSIAVENPIGTGIANAGSKDYGSILVGSSRTLTFTIKNTGTGSLALGAITTDGVNAADFTIKRAPAAMVAPGGYTNFVLKFTPGATGNRSAMVHIANSDSANNPFNITVGGTGTTPSIAIENPINTGIANAGSRDFGSILVGKNKTLTFTIRNTGTGRLALGAITTDGVNAADFAVKIAAAASVAPGSSSSFVLKFTPGASGNRSAMVHIANNDSTHNPFDIHVSGTGIAPAAPVAALAVASSGLLATTPTTWPGDTSKTIVTVNPADGLKYLTLLVAKAPGTANQRRVVEVSSNLVDWFSGRNHTTVLRNDAWALKVRDNTPLTPGMKRYIRQRNPVQ